MIEANGQSGAAGAVVAAEGAGGRASWWNVLGWAAYLACSWTWCIGMFLPVLLVRDYGVWGFVVFAVPNVVGAGAMGWVLTRTGSVAMTRWTNHRWACVAFSWITIAFQVFFLFSMALPVLGPGPKVWAPWPHIGLLLVLVVLGVCIGARPRIGSAITLVVSTALLLSVFRARGGIDLPMPPDRHGLLFLAPVCLFGFALCPYLDLTFHRARIELGDGASRSAFSIGFGVFFLAMIVGTLTYATLAIAVLDHTKSVAGSLVAGMAGAHIALQLTATIALHKRELVLPRENEWNAGSGLQASAMPGFLLGMAALIVVTSLRDRTYFGLTSFEVVYRCFMSFYGLVFPAYVWLCMIPTADGHSGIGGERGRRKLMVLGVACALATPCYWMGFIERVEWWLAVGLGVVLVARVLVRSSSSPASAGEGGRGPARPGEGSAFA